MKTWAAYLIPGVLALAFIHYVDPPARIIAEPDPCEAIILGDIRDDGRYARGECRDIQVNL